MVEAATTKARRFSETTISSWPPPSLLLPHRTSPLVAWTGLMLLPSFDFLVVLQRLDLFASVSSFSGSIPEAGTHHDCAMRQNFCTHRFFFLSLYHHKKAWSSILGFIILHSRWCIGVFLAFVCFIGQLPWLGMSGWWELFSANIL